MAEEAAQRDTDTAGDQSTEACIRAWLYDACGHDRAVALDELEPGGIAGTQLVWVDVEVGEGDAASGLLPGLAARLAALLGGDPRAILALLASPREDGPPHLDKYAGLFTLTLLLPPEQAEQSRVGFAVAHGWLLSVHQGEVAFLESFRAQDKAETAIGLLSAPTLLASLLDWHLDGFLAAIARIEEVADRLDRSILSGGSDERVLRAIVALRQRIAALRRALGRQRQVFHALTRADLTVEIDAEACAHFERLAARYDRTVDEMEHAREVLIGSFDLFTTLAAHSTNGLVKTLTFLTAVIGVFSAVAGLLGMNFQLGFFHTGLRGFALVVGGLLTGSAAAVWYARRRGWL